MENINKSYHEYNVNEDEKTISMCDIEFIAAPLPNIEAVTKLAERLRKTYGEISIDFDAAKDDTERTVVTSLDIDNNIIKVQDVEEKNYPITYTPKIEDTISNDISDSILRHDLYRMGFVGDKPIYAVVDGCVLKSNNKEEK